jgi:hypothetical protein
MPFFSPLPAIAEGTIVLGSVRLSVCHINIDLIFGMWLYLDELQFKFKFRSG